MQILITLSEENAVKNPLGLSQREKPYRVGFVVCVGEKPLKNPYF
jgi:hypothetical protein